MEDMTLFQVFIAAWILAFAMRCVTVFVHRSQLAAMVKQFLLVVAIYG